ncbi:MAG: hypothetical protein IJ027_06605 [Oscillospiraceae bacterium]|nr:hypothetical protein [Oscillospiraceae bacterium]
MLNFFDWIVGFFETIGEIITMIIDSLLTAISVIASAVAVPVIFTGLVPQILLTAMLALVSLAVIKFLLGR